MACWHTATIHWKWQTKLDLCGTIWCTNKSVNGIRCGCDYLFWYTMSAYFILLLVLLASRRLLLIQMNFGVANKFTECRSVKLLRILIVWECHFTIECISHIFRKVHINLSLCRRVQRMRNVRWNAQAYRQNNGNVTLTHPKIIC